MFVAEVITGLMSSHLIAPAGAIPIDSDEDVRRFAEDYLVPIVTGEARRIEAGR
jgi:hypothetical protein